MPSYIPFVNSQRDSQILEEYYNDAPLCRLTLEHIPKLKHIVDRFDLWIDPALDGYDRLNAQPPDWSSEWCQVFSDLKNRDLLADPDFRQNPIPQKVREFVLQLLDRCLPYRPKWLSIPQLPARNNSHNKINRQLAQAAQEWKTRRRFSGKMILPFIFRAHGQYKVGRKELITRLLARYNLGAAGVWVVDSSLSDQEAREPYMRRFEHLIQFHQELFERLPSGAICIGGPYWAMNLLLWARGFIHHAAICLGASYQYHLPNFTPRKPVERVALEPLRRWAPTDGLQAWLGKAARVLAANDPARRSFNELRANLRDLSRAERTHWQTAEFYKRWLDELETVPPGGRAIALYQQLSSAVVVGSSLPELSTRGRAKRPDIVARQFMYHCL